jgi:hypothetical protein
MMSFVKGHREIVRTANGPMGQHTALRKVSDLDLMPIWDVYENPSSGFLKLKRLGMGIDGNLSGFLPGGIQQRKPSVAFPADDLAE